MKSETTPAKITDKVIKLCEKVVPGGAPVYVPVEVEKGSKKNECFLNVQRVVQDKGGMQINGWAIWQWANILVETEAHSVWRNQEGKLIDVTPHDGENQILFLYDKNMQYLGQRIGSCRLALTNSPIAVELVELAGEIDDVMCSYKPRTEIPVTELVQRLLPLKRRRDILMGQLNQKVGKNDPCPCQSGLKYEECCGS